MEFAFTTPILLLLVMGELEFSWAYVLYHRCGIAAAEGARQGILPGSTAADCEAAAGEELAIVGIRNYTIGVSLSTSNDNMPEITVTASVPMTLANGYLLPRFLSARRPPGLSRCRENSPTSPAVEHRHSQTLFACKCTQLIRDSWAQSPNAGLLM